MDYCQSSALSDARCTYQYEMFYFISSPSLCSPCFMLYRLANLQVAKITTILLSTVQQTMATMMIIYHLIGLLSSIPPERQSTFIHLHWLVLGPSRILYNLAANYGLEIAFLNIFLPSYEQYCYSSILIDNSPVSKYCRIITHPLQPFLVCILLQMKKFPMKPPHLKRKKLQRQTLRTQVKIIKLSVHTFSKLPPYIIYNLSSEKN